MFTRFRKPSSVSIMLGLWHDTEIEAVILNSTGKQTDRATVGETITIEGTLKDKVNPSIKPYNKALKMYKKLGEDLKNENEKDQGNCA